MIIVRQEMGRGKRFIERWNTDYDFMTIITAAGQEKAGDKVYLAASVLLLILNISLIVPITIMVKQQKPVHLTMIPAIAMAAYTTYNISMAFINLRRSRNS